MVRLAVSESVTNRSSNPSLLKSRPPPPPSVNICGTWALGLPVNLRVECTNNSSPCADLLKLELRHGRSPIFLPDAADVGIDALALLEVRGQQRLQALIVLLQADLQGLMSGKQLQRLLPDLAGFLQVTQAPVGLAQGDVGPRMIAALSRLLGQRDGFFQVGNRQRGTPKMAGQYT